MACCSNYFCQASDLDFSRQGGTNELTHRFGIQPRKVVCSKNIQNNSKERFYLFIYLFQILMSLVNSKLTLIGHYHSQISKQLFFLRLIFFFWLTWIFIAGHGLSLVATSGGYSLLGCMGFSLQRLLLLQSTGFRHVGSGVVVHGLSCHLACGIFQDQNSCPLHWQVDS